MPTFYFNVNNNNLIMALIPIMADIEICLV